MKYPQGYYPDHQPGVWYRDGVAYSGEECCECHRLIGEEEKVYRPYCWPMCEECHKVYTVERK